MRWLLALAVLALATPSHARIVSMGRVAEFTCSSTPVKLAIDEKQSRLVMIRIVGGVGTVYLGPSTVTVATGFPLDNREVYSTGERLDGGTGPGSVAPYCVGAGEKVRVWEVL